MTILFLSNNEVSLPLFRWLEERNFCKVHYFSEKLTEVTLAEYNPDWIISYNYKYIIGKKIIDAIPGKILNLHISLLPWNKGANPNFWSFAENTPKGVTIHLIDAGIDTGPILVQKELFFDEKLETFASTYTKLNNEIQELFKLNWEEIQSGAIAPFKPISQGSYHNIKDFEVYKSIFDRIGWNNSIMDFKQTYLQK